MYWQLQTSTDTLTCTKLCTHKRTCILQFCHAVFLALIDPITFSKTANAVPYGEPIEMEILLFLMDALNNKPVGGKRFSRQIAAHVVNVHYANVRCRDVVMSHEVGGVIYSPFIIEEAYL